MRGNKEDLEEKGKVKRERGRLRRIRKVERE